jgi:hypothetical protein
MDDNSVKFKFVQETLEKHGKKIIAAMQEGIRYNQYQGTGHMEKTADFSVDRSNNSDGALHIKAVDYLRLQDILASHKGRYKKTSMRLWQEGKKPITKRRRNIQGNQFAPNRKGFYSKAVYREISPILWDLSYGFTQEVIQDIRARFSEYIVKGEV